MRPYPVVEDDAEEHAADARVIPISSAPRAQPQTTDDHHPRRLPWTPRDDVPLPVAPTIQAAPPPPPRAPAVDRTQQLMLIAFVMVCATMIVGMVGWRLWSEGARASSSSEPVSTVPAEERVPPAPAEDQEGPATPAPGAGAITTEIRVLQPEYTVAPGDTLASIARRHGTTIEALASINKLENRNSLSVGQRLIIP